MQHAIPVDALGPQGEAMAGAIESCVHCGFCLPTCPTYATMGEEMDSPRGRIFLMKEVLEGQLELETALPYVDNCLGCQACETACPSGRRLRRAAHARSAPTPRSAATAVPPTAPGARWSCGPCPTRGASARRRGWADWRGRGRVARCSRSPWRAMLRLLPDRLPRARPLPAVHPAEGAAPRAGGAAGRLRAAGARARTSAGRRCACWRATASRRSSRARRAAAARWRCTPAPPTRPGALARRNLDAFPDDVDAVITNAAGCGSGMQEYGLLFAGEPEQARGRAPGRARASTSARSSRDLGLSAPPPPAARPATVAYHDACHLAHAQGVRDAPRALLRRDRRRHARASPPSGSCAAGRRAPTTSRSRTPPPSWASARRATSWPPGADLVATGNIGCLTQVQTPPAGARPRGPGRCTPCRSSTAPTRGARWGPPS